MKKIISLLLVMVLTMPGLAGCGILEKLCSHTFDELETLSSKPATCSESGLTEGKKCALCGKIIIEQEELSPLGHIYEYTSEFDEEGNRVNVAICERENCTERKIFTDKERLIGEWRNAAGVYEGDIEITVKGFIHQIALSYWPELVLTISEDNIYFFSQQYLYEVQLVSNYNYSFDYMLLGNSDKIINGEKVSDIIEKIQACETGYLLQTKTGQGPDSGFRIFIVRVENYYYFSLIDNYSNNPVYHIYYTDFSEVSE